MNETDIQEFVRQTEKDLQVAREFLAMWTRRNGATKAAMLQKSGAIQAPLIPESAPVESGNGYGSNKRAILKAIESCPVEYTLYDVEKVLTESGSPLLRPAISQALSRLSKDEEITIHRKGGGRKAAIYRKA